MAVLAPPPDKPLPALLWEIPEAQSLEGRSLQQAVKEALRHRSQVETYRREDVDEFSYQSVPMEQVFTVLVKYRLVGAMAPLPYLLDE